MTATADFLTVDAFSRPKGGLVRWRRGVASALRGGVPGLRKATVNTTNNGTHSVIPALWRPGGCLVAAWDSADAAAEAWRGPLGMALAGQGRFSLDGEVARVRLEEDDHRWYGWRPSAEGARPIAPDEPIMVVVHGVLRPQRLHTFALDNVHAASRATHHPGHRGSIDISAKLPFEHTSVSLWSSLDQARDFAYQPGGHAFAMMHSREVSAHKVGVFLQVRPLASSGKLGIDEAAFPDLPPAVRT